MPGALDFTLAVLATWRVSHLLSREDGPWGLCLKLRRAAGQSFLGKLVGCPYCVSMWAAVPAGCWLGRQGSGCSPTDWMMIWLGTSGGACLIERLAPPPLILEALEDPAADEEKLP